MKLTALLPLQFILQAVAFIVFFTLADDIKTANWLVSGIIGIIAGLIGIAYAFKSRWDNVSRSFFGIASLAVAIGWGSWAVIAPISQANDPVINITGMLAPAGWLVQIFLAAINRSSPPRQNS